MSNKICHPFHLVDLSPWPLLSSISALGTTTGLVVWFHDKDYLLLFTRIFLILLIIYQWWRDIGREATYQGLHTYIVETGLRWGMLLFICSEVMFFFSFFWAFFHRRLSPRVELGNTWPPLGIQAFNPFGVPLINTIILLSSGVSITWSHHALIEGNLTEANRSILVTIILGLYFTMIQLLEYIEAPFTIRDSAFGSTFFVATGFHGLHVVVGTTFLIVTFIRITKCSFRSSHHFGFEAAAWYWHFVDVVWLFLFVTIYWWGGKA
jgi:cytochrome c oxidase subunit 3